jgi:hypothetical protein
MGKITVSTTLDLDAIFEEIDTDDLIEELRDRASFDDDAAAIFKHEEHEGLDLPEHDLLELRRAAHLDDGKRALEIVRRYLA